MHSQRLRAPKGFGLMELMIVLVVAGLLAALALPAYSGFIDQARVKSAIGDIGSLHIKLEEFRIKNNDQLRVLDSAGKRGTADG